VTRRDLTAALRVAARAMPAAERLRFSRFLRGLEGRDPPDVVPGTPFLPPITVNRPPIPARKGARIRAKSVAHSDLEQLRLL
jgi:hypothetical protein